MFLVMIQADLMENDVEGGVSQGNKRAREDDDADNMQPGKGGKQEPVRYV